MNTKIVAFGLFIVFILYAGMASAIEEPDLGWKYLYYAGSGMKNVAEDSIIFIGIIDVGHTVDTSKLQVEYAKSDFEVIKTGNPLEVRHLIGEKEHPHLCANLHIQWYEDGRSVIYIVPIKDIDLNEMISRGLLFGIDDFLKSDSYIRNPVENAGFSYSEIQRIKNLDNWNWYSREPGIWTFIAIPRVNEFSFVLADKPEYFYTSYFLTINGHTGLGNDQNNHNIYVFQGDNFISSISDTDRTKGFLASTTVEDNNPSIFKFEFNTGYINDFWAEYGSEELSTPTPTVTPTKATPTSTVTPTKASLTPSQETSLLNQELNKDSDDDGVPDEYDYAPLDAKVQTKTDIKSPGFEVMFAILGLFVVVYIFRNRE